MTGVAGYEPEIFSKQGMDIAAKTFIILTHIPDLTLVEQLTGFPPLMALLWKGLPEDKHFSLY